MAADNGFITISLDHGEKRTHSQAFQPLDDNVVTLTVAPQAKHAF